MTKLVSDSQNYKLLMWISGERADIMLYSEMLQEGINCEIGHSIVTIRYIDDITGAKTD